MEGATRTYKTELRKYRIRKNEGQNDNKTACSNKRKKGKDKQPGRQKNLSGKDAH